MFRLRLKNRFRHRPPSQRKLLEARARRATVYVTRDGRGRVIDAR